MPPPSPGQRRPPQRFRLEGDEESFGSLQDKELLALISQGGFHAEESCDAIEEALRRGLECVDGIALMRDLLFGFETSRLRYRAAINLVRLNIWDDDIHRALCHAVAKLPVDDPLARSARLQLQKRALSPADPPDRPKVGSATQLAAPAQPREEPAAEAAQPPQQHATPLEAPQAAASVRGDMTPMPRYTAEDVEEPRLRYRRRKRKRGHWVREVFANLQILLLFVIGFIVFLLILGRC